MLVGVLSIIITIILSFNTNTTINIIFLFYITALIAIVLIYYISKKYPTKVDLNFYFTRIYSYTQRIRVADKVIKDSIYKNDKNYKLRLDLDKISLKSLIEYVILLTINERDLKLETRLRELKQELIDEGIV